MDVDGFFSVSFQYAFRSETNRAPTFVSFFQVNGIVVAVFDSEN